MGPEEARHDHTRPMVAFIGLAVAAAAMIAAGLTGGGPDVPVADPPVRSVAPGSPALEPGPVPTTPSTDFALAEVVTLATAEPADEPRRRDRSGRTAVARSEPAVTPARPRQQAAAPTPTSVRRPGDGSGAGASGGPAGSGSGAGSGGSVGPGGGSGAQRDRGPGRSEFGERQGGGRTEAGGGKRRAGQRVAGRTSHHGGHGGKATTRATARAGHGGDSKGRTPGRR